MENPLTQQQEDVLEQAGHFSVFLEGPPGSGKTTVGVAYLERLIQSGVPASNIMVLLPQRTMADAYFESINSPDYPYGGVPQIVTFGGLARRMTGLFWPLISENAGFSNPHNPPKFLTLETAQYYAAQIIQPLLDENRFFNSITINRNRLYSQILDNLNKAALIGLPHDSIGERLKSAWVGKPEQMRIYDEVQVCIDQFRAYCLKNNLLDFSLQIETFCQHLWPSWIFQDYFYRQFQYLIYDNVEEDAPIVHDHAMKWIENFENYFLIYDHKGGYRLFLGADPESGYHLKDFCQHQSILDTSFIQSPEITHLQENLANAINRDPIKPDIEHFNKYLQIHSHKYYPEMVNWLTGEVGNLIANGTSPGQICIIAPFLSDSLRFEFAFRFEQLNIPFSTHRPSRSLREEPATSCLLTLLKLIHPEWGIHPSHFEFRSMLMQAITGFDLIRADILSKIVYRSQKPGEPLGSFDAIQPVTQERITYSIGERYEFLRNFIIDQQSSAFYPIDIQLSVIFSELLSLPGFGFSKNLDAAETTSRLIDSYSKFSIVYARNDGQGSQQIAQDYVTMIQRGVLAALYIDTWEKPDRDSVFLSPAHTYLMANRPVDHQFWLDIGSHGWWERLNQPLTHPYVLSRSWPVNEKWTDQYEYQHNQQSMKRLVEGLLFRCRKQVTLCIVQINEQGNEQKSPLLRSIQKLAQAASRV